MESLRFVNHAFTMKPEEESAARIIEARKAAKMSKAALAKACDVSWPTVNSWEKGEYAPNADNLEKIARATGKTMSWLRGSTDKQPALRLVESHVEPVNEHPQERQLREFEEQHGDRFPDYVYRMIRASEYGRHGLTEGQLLDAAKRYQSQEEEALNAIQARLGPPKRTEK